MKDILGLLVLAYCAMAIGPMSSARHDMGYSYRDSLWLGLNWWVIFFPTTPGIKKWLNLGISRPTMFF